MRFLLSIGEYMFREYGDILTLSNFLGFLGIIFAFLIGKWYSKKHKLNWYVDTREFFDLKKDLNKTDIQITYKDIPLKSLAQSYVYIWNSGNEIIDKQDLDTIQPLQLYLANSDQVFEYKIKKVTRDVIAPTLVNNKNISFEYLDPKDGFVIEILHSSHDTKKLLVNGVVKKIQKLSKQNKSIKIYDPKKRELRKKILIRLYPLMTYIPLIFGLIMISTGFIVEPRDIVELKSKTDNNLSIIVMGVLYCLLTPLILFSNRRKYPKYLELDDSNN